MPDGNPPSPRNRQPDSDTSNGNGTPALENVIHLKPDRTMRTTSNCNAPAPAVPAAVSSKRPRPAPIFRGFVDSANRAPHQRPIQSPGHAFTPHVPDVQSHQPIR